MFRHTGKITGQRKGSKTFLPTLSPCGIVTRMESAARTYWDTATAYREAVAGEIRSLMGRRRVKQGQLAEALSMSQAAVSRRLTAELPFNTDELVRVAEFFGIELHRLLPPPDGGSRQSGCVTAGSEDAQVIPLRRITGTLSPEEQAA